ncbi:MAG: vitamin K epoxide reductase family protein [Microlunatus sp.]|nr:vitamin K epoxide reductase family protein [Microlunatus sp.]MDN5804421.1 vitamin K epoxide reductase family protein [Microlunatus sp.]
MTRTPPRARPAADADPDLSELDVTGTATVVATRTVAWVLLVAGLVGFAAAFVLAVEKYLLLTNPFYTPSCTINTAISCGPVMSSPQAAVFGFPNPYLGIAGFAVVAATGAMLLAGGRLAGWYTAGLQIGAVLGTVFVAWLMVQSLTVIHALCPYCMAAWAATFAIVWYVTITNLGRIRHRLPDTLDRAVGVAGRNHSAILAGWLLIVAVLVTVTAWQF